MRIISQNELTKKLFDHPYANSPEYHAGMSVVHISDDGRLLIGYWHAPKGEVEINYGINVEYNYVISGKISVIDSDGNSFFASAGDIIECGGKKGAVKYHIQEYAKTLFVVYPQSKEDLEFVLSIQSENNPIKFTPK